MAPLAPNEGRTAECAAKADVVDTRAECERSLRSRGRRKRTVLRWEVREEASPAARKKARKCGVVVDVPKYGPWSKAKNEDEDDRDPETASISFTFGLDNQVYAADPNEYNAMELNAKCAKD